MKGLILIGVLLLSLSNITLGREFRKAEEQIQSAFEKGDANALSRIFSGMLVLEMPDKAGSYSKSQAQMIMRAFFSKHNADSFSISRRGNHRDGSKFLIGFYESAGSRYRVYIILKSHENQLLIHHLNISVHE